MSRELRPGDRVTATGIVVRVNDDGALVDWDGAPSSQHWHFMEVLTLIEPAEPPVGSVVVKDGVAWIRTTDAHECWYLPTKGYLNWSDLSDGDVIFRASEDA